MRDIKRRIRSVKSTEQITRAMKMVAAAKLKGAERLVQDSRPYSMTMKEVFANIMERSENLDHPLLQIRKENRVCYVVITADRGLCGGFNINIMRTVLEHSKGKGAVFLPIGRKGRDYLAFRDYPLLNQGFLAGDTPDVHLVQNIVLDLINRYNKEEFDAVYLAYSRYISPLTQEPKIVRLLPAELDNFTNNQNSGIRHEEYLYEPSPNKLLNTLIPRYLITQVYGGLVENHAGELGARMTAMDNATENAEEMIASLTLQYNRARQAAITQEISEIVGGAEALS
jgi:F-type H+-transporting ATPase subunit gamma